MRTVYATVLEVRAPQDIGAAIELAGRWIQDWYLRQRIGIAALDELGADDLDVRPAEGHRLQIKHRTSKAFSKDVLIDIHWEYPDQYDSSLGWVIHLSLCRGATGLLLSLDVAVTGLRLVFAPATVKLGSPRVVRDIARLRSVFLGGHLYNVTPELVGADEIELLVGELTDRERPYPIVVISRQLEGDRPLVDAQSVAERLAGVAKVYELSDKWSAYRLTEVLSKELSCYAGAVRLYWPRFSNETDPFAHPLWMPYQFRDPTASERSLNQLSNVVLDAAAFRHVEPPVFSSIRQAAERELREELRSKSSMSADELLNDLIALEEKLKDLQAHNAELSKENETLRANAAALTAHYASAAAAQNELRASEAPPEGADSPSSVADAVAIARRRAKCMLLLESAEEAAKDSPYRQPERALQALMAIDEVAAIWSETLRTGKSVGSIRELFKKRGFDYADDVSQTSKGKWGSEYAVQLGGRSLDISPHITLGAKQADTCLSIHWCWDEKEGKAVIAHVGRHKTNTRT